MIDSIKELEFDSVLELGCGAGANLWRIKQQFPKCYIQGIDINKDAVSFLESKFYGDFTGKVWNGEAEKIYLFNKAVDLILTDACLMYIPPEKIENTVKEMLRVARKYIVMCEWNGEDKLDGHWVRDYEKLFKGHNVKIEKIKGWSGGWEDYGSIIIVEIKDK